MSLSIGIVGTGALGTLMAWHWREQQLFIRQRSPMPLHIKVDRNYRLTPPVWEEQALDWLVITTKATDTLQALDDIKPSLIHVKRILLLQNGMGQHEDAEQWLTDNWLTLGSQAHPQIAAPPELWAATSTEGAYRHHDGHIVYAGQGHTFAGPWTTEESDEIKNASKVILPPGIIYDSGITHRLRAKLAINAIINPLTGHYRCKNGELLRNADYAEHFQNLASEIDHLFSLLNWSVGFNIPQQAINIAKATASNQSSTFQDILNHRPTELPYISGYLLEQAQKYEIPLPLTEALYQELCLSLKAITKSNENTKPNTMESSAQ